MSPPQSNRPAGAVFIDLAGTGLTDVERDRLLHPQVGGVVLFERNHESAEQLRALSGEIRRLRPSLVISVDQEGGRVQRFRDGFTLLPPAAALGERYAADPQQGLELARACGRLCGAELAAVGVDLSFAPVLDVDLDRSAVIGHRSFSAEPSAIVALAGAWIDGAASVGMPTVGKHYPGHGGVVADSHVELPTDARDFATIESLDLVPFAALAERLAGVMTAHVHYPACDPEVATFSRWWLQRILRERCGFEGLVFSDDLAMRGAAGVGEMPARVRAAIDAGCDRVLVCNDSAGADAALGALEAASHRAARAAQRLHRSCDSVVQATELAALRALVAESAG